VAQSKSILKFCIAAAVCMTGLSALAQLGLTAQLNDSFAHRTVVGSPFPGVATNFLISGSLSNATIEAGESFIDDLSSGQTVWGTWTAPANGSVTLSVNAKTFSPLLTVYAGIAPINDPGSNMLNPIIAPSVFTNLSLIASNNYLVCYEHAPCGCHWRERNQITFHVTRGQAYQLCVDSAIITDAAIVQKSTPVILQPGNITIYGLSWETEFTTNVLTGGAFFIGMNFTRAPDNDDFEQRTAITGKRLSILTSNGGATRQFGEPDHLGNSGGSSVWYSWSAPTSGRVTLSENEVLPYAPPDSTSVGVIITTGPDTPPLLSCGKEVDQNPPPIFYPVFAAYTGSVLNSLIPADCLPAKLNTFPHMIEFDAVKGQTYQIALDGNRGTTGDIPFYLALTTAPPNDNFAQRIQLHSIYASATGYNAGATRQTGEPVFGDSLGKTAWWTWTAPVSGTVAINLEGSDYAFPVAVRTGSALAGLQIIAGGNGGVSFEAVAGQAYQIAVSDAAGLTGNIRLKLQAPVVELSLLRTQRLGNSARLYYAALPGQKILLQRSVNGSNWQDVQTAVAERSPVQFTARPAPGFNGSFYRAIIVDRNF
jgi:hypothetical protein